MIFHYIGNITCKGPHLLCTKSTDKTIINQFIIIICSVGHHDHKLLEADEPVLVLVRLLHHPRHLPLGGAGAHVGQHLLQLRQAGHQTSTLVTHPQIICRAPDEAVTILIKQIEGLFEVI